MTTPEREAKKRERLWDITMALSAPVGLLLGVSTFVRGGFWTPALVVAAGYLVALMLVGGYIGRASRNAGNGKDALRSGHRAGARRDFTRAGLFTACGLAILLARSALGGDVPDAIFWIAAITLIAIGVALTGVSVRGRE